MHDTMVNMLSLCHRFGFVTVGFGIAFVVFAIWELAKIFWTNVKDLKTE